MMKIAIIAAPRTKSTALLQQIVAENPEMISLGEAYFREFKTQLRQSWSTLESKLLVMPRRDFPKRTRYAADSATRQFWEEISIKNITDKIYKQDNFVVKIMGKNLEGDISDFGLCNCDLIYFIERKNFFDQCCSLEVAWRHDVWNNFDKISKDYEYVQNQRFSLSKYLILYQAHSIHNYMLFKKHAIDNKIPFVQKYYESVTFNDDLTVKKSNLDYSRIFTNYDKKDLINKLFDSNASYENLYFNIQNFIKDLRSIKFDYDSVDSEIKDKLNFNILIKNIIGTP